MKNIVLMTVALLTLVSGVNTSARELVIIAEPTMDVEQISLSDIVSIYTGKSTDSGVTPFHLSEDTEEYKALVEYVLDESVPKYQRMWAKRMFSGQGLPPVSVYNQRAMIHAVISHSSAVGYVFDKDLVDDVKVLFKIPLK